MRTLLASGVVAAAIAFGAPAKADPSYGIGLTWIFGGDFALGFRVFGDDEPDSAVLAIGADYKFGSGAFRPTAGIAYLDEDYYLDLSLGYDLGIGALDYGIGLGGAFETDD